ncbi:hypothetical protein G6F46_009041 [Rhizopus delemar]|uniref:Uncharacterized protein n=1 Tax=Rhizopus delemar TaxID=936053 RepID=A0A9P6YXL7_9FUNG|nr:hypothetical protein G6F36_015021 [Rhizopus arrhizus]KAG1458370.1 hypothetical protein G6F55_005388 [Rhizopus delemar]KAG1493493.1 hypothetical protein G6F54_008540 [Rhizopus delemar]KAG1495346.1 hypothetical protein G6F52_013048 [Rhizopus delemar]KAG1510708.1 hypothetical protein G6F53_006485 [Rhizopus delemar]
MEGKSLRIGTILTVIPSSKSGKSSLRFTFLSQYIEFDLRSYLCPIHPSQDLLLGSHEIIVRTVLAIWQFHWQYDFGSKVFGLLMQQSMQVR